MIVIGKAPHRSPQPQRPTNQVGCGTERDHDDCDFKQAFDRVQGRAIGRHGAIAALAAINISFQASVHRLLFILRCSARQSTR